MSTTPLTGQTTVLVGATGNIGKGLISAQLDAGADVVVVGRNSRRLDAVRHQFDPAGDRVIPVQGDVSTFDGAETVATAVTERVGPPDHVVVGINAWMQGEPFWSVSDEAWQQALDITTTYFAASRALAPQVRAGGSLTLILGLSAYVALPLASPVTIYGGALRSMRSAFSRDLGDRVRVNSTAFAQISSESRGAHSAPDWITDRQVGEVMTHVAASTITGTDLMIPDVATYEAFIGGDTAKAIGD